MPRRERRPCRLFLFDLDGTLIDSKLDIAGALNRALRRAGLRALTLEQVIGFGGEGVENLIRRALGASGRAAPGVDEIRRVLDMYLAEYEAHILDETHLYPEVAKTLDRMGWARFAVVTNKPE